MRRVFLACAIVLGAAPLTAQSISELTADAVNNHVLPGYDLLAEQSQALAAVARDDCNATSPALRVAYGEAFDAWLGVSHMRFGPSERDDRAFGLAFWPDSRSVTPKTLSALIASEDDIALNPDDYADVSIAARGFYALEFLLYDDAITQAGSDAYRCTLIQTVTADIATTTAAISAEWHESYADQLLNPSDAGTYHTEEEAAQELFKAVSTGLEFVADTRLGRPLGTFDRPRPKRAEAWRSGRSARHVKVSLTALRDLALRLSGGDAALTDHMTAAFDQALRRVEGGTDPVFASVADPMGRFEVEVLQQNVNAIRTVVRDELGPKLGVIAGFNALDGD